MNKHPHAELMIEYGKDALESDTPWKNWEYRSNDSNRWCELKNHPEWNIYIKYRRKPQTVTITITIPKPLSGSDRPNLVDTSICTPNGNATGVVYIQHCLESINLDSGLFFKTEEDCFAFMNALQKAVSESK